MLLQAAQRQRARSSVATAAVASKARARQLRISQTTTLSSLHTLSARRTGQRERAVSRAAAGHYDGRYSA